MVPSCAFALASAVRAACDVDADESSHELGESGADIGGSHQGGRVLAKSFACGYGGGLLISGALRIIGSNPIGILG